MVSPWGGRGGLHPPSGAEERRGAALCLRLALRARGGAHGH